MLTSLSHFTQLRKRVILFLLCLLLSTCTSAAEPYVIKIGLVAPFEGAYRATGYDAIYAARLAIREINATSLQDGWALELVAYDDRSENDLAISTARNLVIDPDVLAVIGHYASGTTHAAGPIYAEAGIPFLIIGEGPSGPTNWHTFPPTSSMVEEFLGILALPAESAVVWGEGDLADEFKQQLSSLGMQVHIIEPQQLGNSSPYIFSTLFPLETAEYLRIWSEQGWQGQLYSTASLHTDSFARMSGHWRDRACFLTPYPLPDDIAGLEQWSEAYAHTGPHVPEPGPYALPTYELVYTVAKAIEGIYTKGNVIDRHQLNQELGQVQRVGKLGTLQWNSEHFLASTPRYLYCWENSLRLIQTIP